MKKILLVLFMFLSILSNIFAEDKNLEYLVEKFKIRKTIELLEKIKSLYDINSPEYKIIQRTENYFTNKIPVDAFSVYTRIKLYNIIENRENKIKNENQNSEILTANTDLEYLYQLKQEKIKRNISDTDNSNPKGLSPIPMSSKDINYYKLSPEQLKSLVKSFNH